LSFLFFFLGLMANPAGYPSFVLLLLEYWPLRRFLEINRIYKVQTKYLSPLLSDKQKKKSKKEQALKKHWEVKKPADPEYKWSLIYPLSGKSSPFVLGNPYNMITYLAGIKEKLSYLFKRYHPVVRIANAFISYIAYIGKMIWPSNLPSLSLSDGLIPWWRILGSVFLLIAITLVVSGGQRDPLIW